MKVNQNVKDNDLARAIRDDQGTFLCQNRGQFYIAISESGHSLTSLRPVGDTVPIPAGFQAQQADQWSITKVSESVEGAYSDRSRENRERVGA